MKIKFLSITVLALFLFVNANAQVNDTTGLAAKKKELADAEATLKKAQAAVDQLKSEVGKLKPITKWTTGGFQAVNFNQVSLTNWSKGGQNSFAVTVLGNAFANYKFDGFTWENNLNLAYGLIRNAGEGFKKNEDKIDYLTRLNKKVTKTLSLAATARFESQFAPGYDDAAPAENNPKISDFMAPAYIKVSLGLNYQPDKYFAIYFSPAAGKFTIVSDDSIAAKNIYIPTTAKNNKFRPEFGALASLTYQNKDLLKNIGIRSSMELFNNYTDPNKPNRKNIDIDWQTIFDIKLGKYIGANLFTHLLYDNDTKYIEYQGDTPITRGARTQFKEVFGIGFSYKF